MSERGPWSVKGIDQRAREAARDAARMEGMTLGEYLNKLILEVSSDTQPNEIRRSGSPSRAESTLDQLARRVEAVEARSTLAITGIDQSVMGLIARLERAEDNQSVVATHVESFIDELRETHAALTEKIQTLEADDQAEQNLEALRSLEQALGKLATHVYEEGERQQEEGDAIRGRVEAGFAHLGERVEKVETGIESRLSDAAKRMEEAVEAAAQKAEAGNEARLSKVETDVSGAIGSMEETLVRIQDRLNRAERTTDAALKGLEGTFDNLDQRLTALTESAGPDVIQALRSELESRFEGLAGELKAEVEASRQAMAEEIAQAAGPDLAPQVEELQSSLTSLADRYSESEARSARAFQSVGEQVSRISESFDKRLDNLEAREPGEADTEALREEIAAVADRVDARLDEIETREASVIERVGEEVGKLADRMEARVTESEEASARAIGQIGDQVASVAKRLQGRQNEAFDALSAKMEDARLTHESRLSDALENMSERLERLQADTSRQVSPVQKAIASLADRLDLLEKAGPIEAAPRQANEDDDVLAAFSAALEETQAAEEAMVDEDDGLIAHEPGDEMFEPGVPDWAKPVEADADDDYVADTGPEVAAAPKRAPDIYDPLAELEDWGEGDVMSGESEPRDSDVFDTPLDTPALRREGPPAHLDLDQDMPRATLDAAEFGAEFDPAEVIEDDVIPDGPGVDPDVGLEEDLDASDYIARARRAALAASASQANSSDGSRLSLSGRAPLYAAASFIVLATAGTSGYLYLRGKQAMPEQVTPASEHAAVTPAEPETEPAPDLLREETMSLAVATHDRVPAEPEPLPEIAPEPVMEFEPEPAPAPQPEPVSFDPIPAPLTLDRAAEDGDRIAQYELGTQYLNESRFAEAASLIGQAAEDGLPVAQYRLSKLHEKGLGLPRDLAAARQWTERAAQAGNIAAMHDLAVYYADGEGGAQSYASAAEWFRRASEYGVLDSQYNLGVLYSQGLGLTADPAEALFWFSVAAENGDPGAPEQVRAMLSEVDADTAREVRERVVSWHAAAPDGPANGELGRQPWQGGGEDRIRAVQVALNALGFDAGSPDGVFGNSTSEAIRQYQAQAGLAETGSVTAELVDSLNARTERSGNS